MSKLSEVVNVLLSDPMHMLVVVDGEKISHKSEVQKMALCLVIAGMVKAEQDGKISLESLTAALVEQGEIADEQGRWLLMQSLKRAKASLTAWVKDGTPINQVTLVDAAGQSRAPLGVIDFANGGNTSRSRLTQMMKFENEDGEVLPWESGDYMVVPRWQYAHGTLFDLDASAVSSKVEEIKGTYTDRQTGQEKEKRGGKVYRVAASGSQAAYVLTVTYGSPDYNSASIVMTK
jgi:hypothetical protein